MNEVGNAEVLLSNMRFEQGFVGSLDTNWVAPSGIPESIDTLRREFITERGLTPVRIMLHGAPGSGKSFYANQLSSKYYVPVIRIKDVIDEVRRNTLYPLTCLSWLGGCGCLFVFVCLFACGCVVVACRCACARVTNDVCRPIGMTARSIICLRPAAHRQRIHILTPININTHACAHR